MLIVFYEELKTWQTAIGAFLGLMALLLGALFNFHLSRRRDAKLRGEETLSIAAALYGEIVQLRAFAARVGRIVSQVHNANGINGRSTVKFDRHFLKQFSFPTPVLYASLAAKVGLLDHHVVMGLVKFHDDFKKISDHLPLLIEESDRAYSYSVLTVLMPVRDAVCEVNPVLRRLEGLLGISSPSAEPDMGDTLDVIDEEERNFAEARR